MVCFWQTFLLQRRVTRISTTRVGPLCAGKEVWPRRGEAQKNCEKKHSNCKLEETQEKSWGRFAVNNLQEIKIIFHINVEVATYMMWLSPSNALLQATAAVATSSPDPRQVDSEIDEKSMSDAELDLNFSDLKVPHPNTHACTLIHLCVFKQRKPDSTRLPQSPVPCDHVCVVPVQTPRWFPCVLCSEL